MPREFDSDLIQFLVIMAIALATALYNWFKKRNAPPDEDFSPPAEPPAIPGGERPADRGRPAPASRPGQSRSLEEEIRRLLGEEEPAPTPPPPPVIVSVPAPPPVPRRAEPPRPAIVPRTEPPVVRGPAVHLPPLSESVLAHQRASQIEERVAEQLRLSGERIRVHKPPAQRPRQAPAAVREARNLVRDRSSLRAAVIASVILAPPKAFET